MSSAACSLQTTLEMVAAPSLSPLLPTGLGLDFLSEDESSLAPIT